MAKQIRWNLYNSSSLFLADKQLSGGTLKQLTKPLKSILKVNQWNYPGYEFI